MDKIKDLLKSKSVDEEVTVVKHPDFESGDEKLPVNLAVSKSQEFDPVTSNLLSDVLNDDYAAIVVEDDSPYAEVRASVPSTDDPTLPQNTIRMWVIGMILTTLGCGMNLLFSLHAPSFNITTYVTSILAWPMGRLWAWCMPNINIFGMPLNPGPFNIKEHTLITIMANVSFSSGPAYTTDILLSQNRFYGSDFGWGFDLLAVWSTQCIGFAFGGAVRKILVEPSSAIWPSNLVTTTFLTNMHINENHPADGWKISRLLFFTFVFIGSFVYYWFPGFIFPALSSFSWITWIKPDNVILGQLFGSSTGLGMFPNSIALDWNAIAGYVGSPLIPPVSTIATIFSSIVIIFWIIVPAIAYSNVWYSKYLPISSASSWDRFGKRYNVSRIIDRKTLTFNQAAYESYSQLYLAPTFAISYGLSFAAITSTIVHTVLFHGREIIQQIKQQEKPDVHQRLMKAYTPVPEWWYLIVFLIFFPMSIVTIRVWNTEMPIWSLVVALLIAVFFLLPVGVIYARTNIAVGLNVITEFLVGYMVPGKPLCMMFFKTFGYITNNQAVTFAQDMKLGHYMKIAPRTLFAAQFAATIWGSLVQVAVLRWAYGAIEDLCAPDQKNNYVCPGGTVFFNSSIIWGVIGPQRQFSPGQVYYKLLFFFILGALLPIVSWLILKKWPNSPIRWMNWPVFFSGTGQIPPATAYNYASYCAVGLFFGWFVKRKWFHWWTKYNYSLSAGLDIGLAWSLLIIFLCLNLTNTEMPSWWGTTVIDTLEANGKAIRHPLAPGESFADKFPALPSKKLVGKNMAVPPSNKEWANGVCGRLNMTTSSFEEKAPHQSRTPGAIAPTWAEALFEKKSSPTKSEASKLREKQCYTVKKRSKKTGTKVDAGMEMPTKATEVDNGMIEPIVAAEVSEETNVDVGMEKLFVAGEVAKAKNVDEGMIESSESTEVDDGVIEPIVAAEVSEETNVHVGMEVANDVSREEIVDGMEKPSEATEVDAGMIEPIVATEVSKETAVEVGVIKSIAFARMINPNDCLNIRAPKFSKSRARKNKKKSGKAKKAKSSCFIEHMENEKGHQTNDEVDADIAHLETDELDTHADTSHFDTVEENTPDVAEEDPGILHLDTVDADTPEVDAEELNFFLDLETIEDVEEADTPEVDDEKVKFVLRLETIEEVEEVDTPDVDAEEVKLNLYLGTTEEVDTPSVAAEDDADATHFEAKANGKATDTCVNVEATQTLTQLLGIGMVTSPCFDEVEVVEVITPLVDIGMATNSSAEATKTLMQIPDSEMTNQPDADAAQSTMLAKSNEADTHSIEVLETAEILLQLAASGSYTNSAEAQDITYMPDRGKDTNQSNVCSLPPLELEADAATDAFGGGGTIETVHLEGCANTNEFSDAAPQDFIELQSFVKENYSSKNDFIGTGSELEGVVEKTGEHLLEFPMNLASSGKVNHPSLEFLRDIMITILVVLLVWSIKNSVILKAYLFYYLFILDSGMNFTPGMSWNFGSLCEIDYTAHVDVLEGIPKREIMAESTDVPDEVDVQLSPRSSNLVENPEADYDEGVIPFDLKELFTKSDLHLETQDIVSVTKNYLQVFPNGLALFSNEQASTLQFQGLDASVRSSPIIKLDYFSNGSTSPTKLSLRSFKPVDTSASFEGNSKDAYFLLEVQQSIDALELDSTHQNVLNPEPKLDWIKHSEAYTEARVGGLEPRYATSSGIEFGMMVVVVLQLLVLMVDCVVSKTSFPRFQQLGLWTAFSIVSWLLFR
ncbi:small oligopeptide transporter [Suhomyces tanzawaensis NRRL Y-17324]|uniref:Small oligopeptide transporter n=1 Tax=Suhomyces tanzawaensis NRRL Y-17324 TaxID=984487 RepID=A0A1E4SRS2_9ASCO|nr:small oligopeptide transporter [Suhomyces tanzawaensis NRRL Y-17324]ODV82195.1 small oligopeptide transporter [Suhomyces tanzawaensis NRRL Y-17324]